MLHTCLRLVVAVVVVSAGCGGKSSPSSPSNASPGSAAATGLACTLGALTDCCAFPVDRTAKCGPEESFPVDTPKFGTDPCLIACGAGETLVQLAPNADEARYGCVACPAK